MTKKECNKGVMKTGRGMVITLLFGALLFVGFRPVFVMAESHSMDQGVMCEGSDCGMAQDVSCVAHCLSAAVNDGIILTVLVGLTIAMIGVVVAFSVRLLTYQPLAFAPERVFRDPRMILTIVKRE